MKKDQRIELMRLWGRIMRGGDLKEVNKLKLFSSSELTEIGVTPSSLRSLGIPEGYIEELHLYEEFA